MKGGIRIYTPGSERENMRPELHMIASVIAVSFDDKPYHKESCQWIHFITHCLCDYLQNSSVKVSVITDRHFFLSSL